MLLLLSHSVRYYIVNADSALTILYCITKSGANLFLSRLTVISLHFSRQFRVMEGDKEAYLDEATKALRRQRKIIEDLDREKSDLERSLRTAKSRQNSRRDGENAAKIARLAEEQVEKKIIFFPFGNQALAKKRFF